MFKRSAFYPFLFILDIILAPLAHNLDQVDASQALRPLIVLGLAAAGGFILFHKLFKDWQYAGYLLFLVSLFLCGFGYLNRFILDQLSIFWKTLDQTIFMAVCAGVVAIFALKGVWVRLGGRGSLPLFLNLAVSLGLVVPIYELLDRAMPEPVQPRYPVSDHQSDFDLSPADCLNTPDIYYIILDGYGRGDVLADLYGFDNQPFLDSLRRKGFYVADQSHTNYIQTIFSIPSGLNFSYIAPHGEDESGQAYFSGLVRRNKIMAMLKRCGYRTVAFESGFFFTNRPVVDIYLELGLGLNEFENLLLADSPVDVLAEELDLELSEHSYEAHRQRVLYTFEKLGEMPQMPGPKFVFAHIISPHPPFIFDQAGQPVEPKYSYYIGDGDDYQGSLEEYLAGYPAQVQFVNQKLEQVFDSLLADSKKPPVIIIQGDHGPGSRLVWDAPEQTCLWERTPILNAYYLPGAGEGWLYPSISPVNSFRVVLNAYFGTNLTLLPDATYFSSHLLERQVIDITTQRTARANCAAP